MHLAQDLLDAVKSGDLPRVAHLLDQDPALANARSETGISAVLLAVYYNQPAAADLLITRGAGLDIFEAAATGRLDRVKELVERTPELADAYAPDGFQPLGLACFFGHAGVADFLLAHGAQVNSASRNAQRVMPLHSAVASRHLAIARALLAHGADVSAAQADEFTPLHGAAENGQADMVKLLLSHGADVTARAADGRTPPDIAREKGHREVAELLRG